MFLVLICHFVVLISGSSRIGDNKKVSQIEMLPDEQLLVLISGKLLSKNRKIVQKGMDFYFCEMRVKFSSKNVKCPLE